MFLILVVSIALQATAAYLAFRLIRQTGRWMAWLLLVAAISLMGLRRCISLYELSVSGIEPDLEQELVALAISALMAMGVALIGPALAAGRRVEDALRKSHEELERRVQARTAELHTANLLLHQEIAERKRTEAVLQVRDRAIAAASNGILITDPRQRDNPVIYVNPAFERITGYTREETVGRNCRFLQRDDRSQEGVAEVRRAVQEGRECRVVVCNFKKDGTPFWNELTVSPVRDEEGNLTHFIGIQNDITERRHAEEQARKLQAELAHLGRLSLGGEMASSLAHELNQPLTAINTYIDACRHLLDAEQVPVWELRKAMARVTAQSLRAGEIIRRLKNFTRKTELERTAVDVNTLVREVAGLIEVEARRRGVALRLDLAESLPAVWADNVQVQQVVSNLALNGIEAMADTEPDGRELCILTARHGENEVEICVQDQGPGLPEEEDVEQIYQPFYTTKPQGMGLGLSISRSIVEAHEGHLWASAERGQGTIFHFTLPVACEEARAAPMGLLTRQN